MRDPLPNIRLLQVFDAVVRHRGFAAAQQELELSVSAISTYMSRLERDLGIVLCHRGRGGFALTSRGELFHAECVRVLGELEGLSRYAEVLHSDLRGRLTVGTIDSVVTDPSLPLASMVGRFSGAHPRVYIDLTMRPPAELQVNVLKDEADVAFGVFGSTMRELVTVPLHREQHWLYCSDTHPLFNERGIAAEIILAQRIATRGYWKTDDLHEQGFAHASATVENMEAQLILILSGAYIGYLPEHFAQRWLDEGRLRPLRPAAFGYQAGFSMIYRRARRREPLIQAFADLVNPAETDDSAAHR